jgi:hypothetical protein
MVSLHVLPFYDTNRVYILLSWNGVFLVSKARFDLSVTIITFMFLEDTIISLA